MGDFFQRDVSKQREHSCCGSLNSKDEGSQNKLSDKQEAKGGDHKIEYRILIFDGAVVIVLKRFLSDILRSPSDYTKAVVVHEEKLFDCGFDTRISNKTR